MKMETKTVLIILITLIIGAIIGALITGAFTRHRVGRFMSMGEPGRLGAHVERIIDPDESQREAVREILRKHSERFFEIHSQFEGQMLALRDSLKKDLNPILTDEQKTRLERGPGHPGPFQGKGKRPGHLLHRDREAPPPDEDRPPLPPPGDDG